MSFNYNPSVSFNPPLPQQTLLGSSILESNLSSNDQYFASLNGKMNSLKSRMFLHRISSTSRQQDDVTLPAAVNDLTHVQISKQLAPSIETYIETPNFRHQLSKSRHT